MAAVDGANRPRDPTSDPSDSIAGQVLVQSAPREGGDHHHAMIGKIGSWVRRLGLRAMQPRQEKAACVSVGGLRGYGLCARTSKLVADGGSNPGYHYTPCGARGPFEGCANRGLAPPSPLAAGMRTASRSRQESPVVVSHDNQRRFADGRWPMLLRRDEFNARLRPRARRG